MVENSNLVLFVALPLFGSLFLLLAGRKSDRWGHWLATGVAASTFVLGLIEFFAMLGRD